MTKEQGLIIGLQLNHIAMCVDDATLKKIKPLLKKIEETVMEDKEYKELMAQDNN